MYISARYPKTFEFNAEVTAVCVDARCYEPALWSDSRLLTLIRVCALESLDEILRCELCG
jgi:hypothetical protein